MSKKYLDYFIIKYNLYIYNGSYKIKVLVFVTLIVLLQSYN